MNSQLRIIVTGLIGQHPKLGGVTWDYLQYLLGLAQLGHDVYYFEDSGQWPYNLEGPPGSDDCIAWDPSENVCHLRDTFSRIGLQGHWAYHFPIDQEWFGLSDRKRKEIMASADLLINVSGTLEFPERYSTVKRRVYVDSDPGFTQAQLARRYRKFSRRVHSHDVYFTFAENPDKDLPVTGIEWKPTRQPIVTADWLSESVSPGNAYTTIMNWTSYRPIIYRERSYGQKDVEFVKYLNLPQLAHGVRLEVAVRPQTINLSSIRRRITPELRFIFEEDEVIDCRSLLERTGWHVTDAATACNTMEAYRNYIRQSRGEWSVAKQGYINGQTGWFSCRSACYLAAGRPVVLQDTGFSAVLPVGDGLVAFQTPSEARDALIEVESRYQHHSEAARELAEEYFGADKVLSTFIEQAL